MKQTQRKIINKKQLFLNHFLTVYKSLCEQQRALFLFVLQITYFSLKDLGGIYIVCDEFFKKFFDIKKIVFQFS